MEAPAFLNLPVQAGGIGIVDLHAIDAEIVFPCLRMLGINQWQGDKRATILLPGGQHRKFVEPDLFFNYLGNWSAPDTAGSEFQKVAHQPAMFPKFRSIRWQKRFRDTDQLFDEIFGF